MTRMTRMARMARTVARMAHWLADLADPRRFKLYYQIDLFTDTAAILNSIVSNSYYGMLRGQISVYLPPEHPIIGI